ncbi:hypothetical protein HaLaN_13891, partial [Haematococcus lacustris]
MDAQSRMPQCAAKCSERHSVKHQKNCGPISLEPQTSADISQPTVIVPVIQLPTSGQQAADKIYRDASQLPSHHSTLPAQSIGPGTPSQAPHDPIPS